MKTPSAFTLLLLLSYSALRSQSTNSPYSILGIGDIENDSYNRTGGMANTGIAYRSDRFLINNNPASYTGLQQQFFSFELSARGQFINYYGSPLDNASASGKDFAIKRLSVGTKITKWWGSSAGLMPYSTSNYLFSYPKNIGGTNSTVPATVDGSGGVNQVYWGNAFQPFKHFSIGVNASYLFGSLTETETLTQEGLGTSLATTKQTFYKNFNFTYGAQYYTALSKKWDISLGATYAPAHKLAADATLTVTDNSTQISSTSDVKNNVDFKLPNASGFGFSITKNKKYTFSGDYKYQAWTSANNVTGSNYFLKNSDRVSLGFEVSNKLKYVNNFFEKNYLQAGIYYGHSYLDINSHQLNEMGLTLGYGVNSKRNPRLGISLGLDVGQRGTQQAGLIKENYVNFTLTVSYRDLWNARGVKYF
ncbi:MAG: hypothetical protein ABJB86_17575 [Bacteroidota bacterium]